MTKEPFGNAAVSIREIDAENASDLRTISGLHMELLDFGPMAGLGERFVRRACYGFHMDDGTLRCALCEVDGRPAGFIAYTDRSITFHREGLRSHWLAAGFSVMLALLQDPRRVIALIRASRVVASRRSESAEHSDPLGEVVCMAVRRDYLQADFVKRTGARISERLMDYAGEQLRGRGVSRMRALVDADNRSALMLYHSLGATFESYEQAGEPMVEVWFELDGAAR